MKQIIAATSFLTTIPIPLKARIDENDIAKSMRWFPLIGLWIGYILYLILELFSYFEINLFLSSFLTLVFYTLLTGALHYDGFADTIDGFLGGKDKEDTLRIMKESPIGAFGTIGLIFLILGKYLTLYILLQKGQIILMIFIVAWSRWGVVLLNYASSYAKEDGIGILYEDNSRKYELLFGAVILLSLNTFFSGYTALYICLTTILVISLVKIYSEKKIGGITGDIYGFSIELNELLILIICCLAIQ